MRTKVGAALGRIALRAVGAWAATSILSGCQYGELDVTETELTEPAEQAEPAEPTEPTEPAEIDELERMTGLVYYTVARDAPDGRGYHITAVNQRSTRCAGGAMADSCPVDFLDFEHAGLDRGERRRFVRLFEQGHAMVGGWMRRVSRSGLPARATLFVVEPWHGLVDRALTSQVFKVWPPFGEPCLTACPHYLVQVLGRGELAPIEKIDLDPSGCEPAECLHGYLSLDKGPILAAGELVVRDGDDIDVEVQTTLLADAFFTLDFPLPDPPGDDGAVLEPLLEPRLESTPGTTGSSVRE